MINVSVEIDPTLEGPDPKQSKKILVSVLETESVVDSKINVIFGDDKLLNSLKIEFFNYPALTTTIPAQISLKYNCKIVPLRMERLSYNNFEMTVHKPFEYNKSNNYEKDTYNLTLEINKQLEKMILKRPEQWLWSHNRWK